MMLSERKVGGRISVDLPRSLGLSYYCTILIVALLETDGNKKLKRF